MEFRAGIFAAAMVAMVVCSSPAFAQVAKPAAAVAVGAGLPPAAAPAPRHVDLADLFNVTGPFHTFLELLEKTRVLATFQSKANDTSDKEGITIFVPSDAAFAALRRETAKLTADQLKSLMLYHGVPKFYTLVEFSKLATINPMTTFAGPHYTLNVTDDTGSITVKSAWSNPKVSSSVYATSPVAGPGSRGEGADGKASSDAPGASADSSSCYAGYLAVAGGLMLLW